MQSGFWITVSFLIMLASFCSPVAASSLSDESILANDNAVFAVDLYQALRKSDGNIFFSPYSISAAFAMVYAGARGDTEKQMARTLRFSSGQKNLHPAFAKLEASFNKVKEACNVSLNVANSLWPQRDYKLLGRYLLLIRKDYGVSIKPVDYKTEESRETARNRINRWVEEKTENKIREIIGHGVLDAETRLVLVDAIYFKGKWEHPFPSIGPVKAPFYLMNGESVQTPMMSQEGRFGYAADESLQILQMPYSGNELSMIILLPRERAGLKKMEDNLSIDSFQHLRSRLSYQEVIVFLPKFKETSSFKLNETLIGMGMSAAFDKKKADFSGMDGKNHSLFIGAALHKAYVDVDEKGTEAAASTAIVIERSMAAAPPSQPPPIFRADHPFIFIIQDNETGSILFMGRVEDPTSKGE